MPCEGCVIRRPVCSEGHVIQCNLLRGISGEEFFKSHVIISRLPVKYQNEKVTLDQNCVNDIMSFMLCKQFLMALFL